MNSEENRVRKIGAQGIYETSPWRIKGSTLYIGSGEILSRSDTDVGSPWYSYSFTKIVFEGAVVASGNQNSLFARTSNLTEIENLDFLDTSNVTSMANMFQDARSLEYLDVTSFDTSKVTDMGGMFFGTRSLTDLDVSKFDTSNVTSMGSLFAETGARVLDVSNFKTGKVIDMGGVFWSASVVTELDVSGFDTSSAQTMENMFANTIVSSLDVSNFDTRNVLSMGGMFGSLGKRYITSLDLSHFDTSNVISMAYMFYGMNSLADLDVSGFDTSNVMVMNAMFSGASALGSLDISSFSTSSFVGMESMFDDMTGLRELKLGTEFAFGADPMLPNVVNNETWKGHWQNVGAGSTANPLGAFVLTSQNLMATYDGSTMADVYVWQPFSVPLPPTPWEPETEVEPKPEIEPEPEIEIELEPEAEPELELEFELKQEEQVEKKLEEEPVNVSDSSVAYAPQTGDSNEMAILYGILFSALGVLALIAKGRKQSN